LLGGELNGPADLAISGPAGPDSQDSHALAFAETEAYLAKAVASGVGAVLATVDAPPVEKPVIRVAKPRESFARFLEMCRKELPISTGIHPNAVVEPSAEVDPSASVGAFAVVEGNVKIGPGAKIYPFAYVGENSIVGRDAVIYPHAVLYRDVVIGDRTIVHSGAVLGADGFGFTWNGERQLKIPQIGGTLIGADSEIGACTTIDRAMMGSTRVGDDTKIDNLVQIGHNSVIGSHTVIAAQAGVSGSTVIGDRCTLAGQTATVHHITIGNDIILTGRAAASKDLTEPGPYRGAPAIPYGEELRLEAAYRRLPDVLKRLRDMEARLKKLEGGGS
jgi:UDP-3-O-[3-hydroxymyristoyl] glucosamine N-acyltransferase